MSKLWKSAAAVAAVALVASAADASAQVRLSVAGGPTFAVGHLGDDVNMGFNVLAGAEFGVAAIPFGLRLDGMFNQFPETAHPDDSFRVISGSLNGIFALPAVGFSPYVIGGLGVYNSSYTDDDHGGATTNLGANIGLGVRLPLPGLGVFAEARFHNLFSDGDQARFIPLSLGFRF
jgi:hypothetical protein